MVISSNVDVLKGQILAEVPFFYKGVHSCSSIVAMPISFNFSHTLLQFVEVSLGIRSFDLFSIPAFSNRLLSQSDTVLETLKLSKEKHHVERVVLVQHTDFHKGGGSTRFSNRFEEDVYHKGRLIASRQKIRELYPEIDVALVYARVVNDGSEIEVSEVFECGRERVRLITPYQYASQCEAAGIFCLDFRFRKETRRCIQSLIESPSFDIVALPGSAKRFIQGSRIPWKAIKVAYEQHGCRTFVIVHHQDCGAYGGSAGFPDILTEEAHHRAQMDAFEKEVIRKYSDIIVVKVYARLVDDCNKIQFVRFI